MREVTSILTKFPGSVEKKFNVLNEVGVRMGVLKSAADKLRNGYCTRSRNVGIDDAKFTWSTRTSRNAETITALLGTTGCPVIPSKGNVRKARNSGRFIFELSSPKKTSGGPVVTIKVLRTGSNAISPSDAGSLRIFTVTRTGEGATVYVTIRSGAVASELSSMPTRPGPVMTTVSSPSPPHPVKIAVRSSNIPARNRVFNVRPIATLFKFELIGNCFLA
jgi:hypothetical protein